MQMPQQAVLMNLVTKRNIPKGKNSIEIPRADSTFSVQTPTEGDDLVVASQFDLTSTTISPTLRAIKVRISSRAQYFSQEDVLELISQEFARAQGQDIDTDLSAEFLNFHTDNDVGTTNTDLLVAVMRQARRLLMATTVANGGPAPMPLYAVLAPVPLEDLMTNIGLTGSVSSTNPWVPEGLSQKLIQEYHVALPQIVGRNLVDRRFRRGRPGQRLAVFTIQHGIQPSVERRSESPQRFQFVIHLADLELKPE